MIATSADPNKESARAALAQRIADMKSAGHDRNAVFAEAQRLAPQFHLDGEAVLDLVRATFADLITPPFAVTVTGQTTAPNLPPPKSANQEYQEYQEFQRQPASIKEFQRGRAQKKNQRDTFLEEARAGRVPSLSLQAYLVECVHEHHEPQLREGEPAPWESPLFYFLRLAKAHPALTGLSPKSALEKVAKVIRGCKVEAPKGAKVDGWEHWLGVGREDAEAEFFGAWDQIRYLPGYSPLDNAVLQSERFPLRLVPEQEDSRPSGYTTFISLAGWLQVAMGDRNILLPVARVAPLLGVGEPTVSRYRRWAIQDGYLTEVGAYHRPAEGRAGWATEFRFAVDRFPILRERMGGES